jgi:hypothetical protein
MVAARVHPIPAVPIGSVFDNERVKFIINYLYETGPKKTKPQLWQEHWSVRQTLSFLPAPAVHIASYRPAER